MKRRTVLGIIGGVAVPVAGCLRSPDGETPTPAGRDLIESGSGDYPHEIYVHNALDRDVTLTLTVDLVGTEVYHRDHTVAADTGAVVAGITRETLPEGDRRLAVTGALPGGQSSRVVVDVTDCLGSVDFSINPAGELRSTSSIC